MEILDTFLNHTSVRSFENQPLDKEVKKHLVAAAQSGSSSNFVQAYSIIEIQDIKKRRELGKIANCEEYVVNNGVFYVFVADLYRNFQISKPKNENVEAFGTIEALLVSVIDTTIAAQNMSVYAESQDLGICYIGGIRNNLFKVAEILDLPKFTLPVFGLSVGIPKQKNEAKPRLPQDEIIKVDTYQMNTESIKTYDVTMDDYYSNRTSNQQQATWTQKIQDHFQLTRRPDVLDFLMQQGFEFKNKENRND